MKISGVNIVDIKQLRAEKEKYNGKDYSMVVLRKVTLYPLEAGAKIIEPFQKLMSMLRCQPEEVTSWTIRDDCCRKIIEHLTQTVNVKPLPENGKPAEFYRSCRTI